MTMAALAPKYDELYKAHDKQRYHDFLSSLSDNIRFEDDVWVCDKRMRSAHETPNDVSIYFSSVPEKYKTMVKYYAVLTLMQGKVVNSVGREIGMLGTFFRFVGEGCIERFSPTSASRFKEYLDKKDYAESTRACIWSVVGQFLTKMNGYDGLALKNPFGRRVYKPERLHDCKYIPDDVARQLDRVFKDGKIPLGLRCIYWLLRLIPSRISEILGMKIDCVKPFDGHFCVFIPTWKQNGGYREPVMRVIHVNNEGMGGYLLGLLWEQQKAALLYQEYIPDHRQNALFTYRRQWKDHMSNCYSVASWPYVSYGLKRICEEYGVRDERGDIYYVTSHQFRHNGITDRLRAGFTLPQIAEMTAHHGTAMIYASYVHLNLFPETLVEPNLYTDEESKDGNPCILFCGRILNMDSVNETRLLRNLRAHRVPGGICSDVTHCKSGMWSCLDCAHFVPEQEQLSYFVEQSKAWKEKAELFGSDAVMTANFTDIAKRFDKIITKLSEGMEKGNE